MTKKIVFLLMLAGVQAGAQEFTTSALLNHTETEAQQMTPEAVMTGPSPGKAFLMSFLVPGSGEWYAGSPKMAKVFFGSEVVLWAAFLAFKTQEDWTIDDYALFAQSHAGINPSEKDHDFYVNIENYQSMKHYNEAKLRQRNPALLYPETDEFYWAWDNEANRKKFEDMRIKADDAKNRALFVAGGIVINHLISGIDAVRIARGKRKEARLSMGMAGRPEGGVQLSMQLRF